ncbi:MAG: RNase adapter RapZ, partial [Pyramidobacter sp.]|nr:RNase adapter RapZ [Pyramidobacter sp.]
HLLEDLGFFTVDNLPSGMLPELMEKLSSPPLALENGGGSVIDVRVAGVSDTLPQVLPRLREKGIDVQVVFLEASEEILLKRFSLTRRRHPLGFMNSLLEGIALEKKRLSGFRVCADRVIDTTSRSMAQLKSAVMALLARNPTGLQVMVSSFGFKYGVALDADFVFDVRFLANPYYEASLKNKTGLDKEVQDYICADRMTKKFLHQTLEFFQTILPSYHLSGKNYLHIAIGCTGGHHRSVFAADWLGRRLATIDGVELQIVHRDLERDVKWSSQT